MRYTPAGLPALDLMLKHESQALEDGRPRKVVLELRAVALGAVTRSLDAQALGSDGHYTGFLGAARNGRGVLFHITDYQPVR